MAHLIDTNLISGAATISLSESFIVYGTPALFRKALDMYSLFHNSSAMLSDLMNNEAICSNCEYINFINNAKEED